MHDVERAVERLTAEHAEVIDGAIGTSGPLLELLKEARYPNLGKTKGGSGSGDVIDFQAVAMYENIDGIVRSWLHYYRMDHKGDLIPLVLRLHETLKAEHAGGRLDDSEQMFSMFPKFAAQIDGFFDPPREYELTAPCPECEATRIPEGDEPKPGKPDDRPLKWAVRVPVKPGYAVIAECHACGRMWAGRDDLTELAEQMGLTVDWIALREATGDTQNQTTPV